MTAHLGERISALLDGELAPPEVAAAQDHLAECATCRAEHDATAAVRSRVRALPAMEPPAGFIDGLVAHAATATDLPTATAATVTPITITTATARRRGRRRPVWAAGAAAAAALVALSIAPRHPRAVQPRVATFVDAHVTASPGADPLSGLAPVAIPVSFRAP